MVHAASGISGLTTTPHPKTTRHPRKPLTVLAQVQVFPGQTVFWEVLKA